MSDAVTGARRRLRVTLWVLLLLILAAVVGALWTVLGHDSEPLPLAIAPIARPGGAVAPGDYMPSRVEVLLARPAAGAEEDGNAGTAPQAQPLRAQTAPDAIARIASGGAELWVGHLNAAKQTLPAGVHVQRLDWSSAPMAIMRSDTRIRNWSDLAGRTVCVAEDGRHVGRVARDFGAIERMYPVEANALVALRTGACDAAVADASLLQQLLGYPEWKKFSARLMPRAEEPLVALWPANLAPWRQWELRRRLGAEVLQKMRTTLARSIAFEVYMDQDAPDCHS